ncbi:MAG: septation protein A [Gammaproteobacteria bacterium]|nr:septation protein A [Gammaproteobacteria bacterium]
MKFLTDFFPILLFFIAYQAYDIYVATAVAIGASATQVAYFQIRHKKVEKMQWITLGLLVFFGGLTLLLRDPDFIKWKPTVVNWLFAIAFLGSQFIGKKSLLQRMMDQAVTLPEEIWMRLNYIWVSFFIGIGLLNLYVAFNFSEEAWVNFKLFGMLGVTFVFIIAQGFYIARHVKDEDVQTADSSDNS